MLNLNLKIKNERRKITRKKVSNPFGSGVLVHIHPGQGINAIHAAHMSQVTIESGTRHAQMSIETLQTEPIGGTVAAAGADLHGMHAGHLLRVQIAAHRPHRRLSAHIPTHTAAHLRLLLVTAHAALSAHAAAHELIAAAAARAHELIAAVARPARVSIAAEVLLAECVSDVQSVLLEHQLFFFEREHFGRVVLIVVGDEAVAARVATLVRDYARVFDVTEVREVVAQFIL